MTRPVLEQPHRPYRARTWLRRLLVRFGLARPVPADRLPALPVELRRGDLAERYLVAEATHHHRRAGATATAAALRAVDAGEWQAAETWSHRALWHFERAEMWLHATRAARRLGDVRVAAGDAAGARRYYTEAISEARDLGAEREEGLAALGLGRAELDLGNVTTARRLARIAADLLERARAPSGERAAALELRGVERRVGQGAG